MKTGSILGITFVLLAIVSVMQGAVVIYITSAVQSAMSASPMTSIALGMMSPYLTFAMIFGALQVLLGIAAFVSGILLLAGKGLGQERKRLK